MKNSFLKFIQSATVMLTCAIAFGQVSFSPPTEYVIGSQAKYLCKGDFNNDGKDDFITDVSNTLNLFLGNDTDILETPIGIITDDVWISSICKGDFNKDGNLDIAVHDNGPGKITLFFGDGTGNFSLLPNDIGSIQTGVWNNGRLCSADFNNDGNLDLVIGTSFNLIKIAFGAGDGSFSAMTQILTGVSSRGELIASDFNNDGNQDVVSNNAILLGNGFGGFDAVVATGNTFDTNALVSADFNNDGRLDLLLANTDTDYTNGRISLFLANGSGGFSAPTDFFLGTNTKPLGIASGDFNGDGKLDIATVNTVNNNPIFSSSVSYFLGNGSGGFSAPTFVAIDNFPNTISISDVNNDGKPDITVTATTSPTDPNALAVGKITVLLNTTALATNEYEDSSEFGVYPNPSVGQINVINTKGIQSIKVVNVVGQILIEENPNNQNRVLNIATDGTYFVIATSEKETIVKKILIRK